MSKTIPSIMRTVVYVAIKILAVDKREAMTAISLYLKNTSNRASAKKHKANTSSRPAEPHTVLGHCNGLVRPESGYSEKPFVVPEDLSSDGSTPSD